MPTDREHDYEDNTKLPKDPYGKSVLPPLPPDKRSRPRGNNGNGNGGKKK